MASNLKYQARKIETSWESHSSLLTAWDVTGANSTKGISCK